MPRVRSLALLVALLMLLTPVGPVTAQAASIPTTVERLAGGDRYATSAAVARKLLTANDELGVLWIATGQDFPDALAVGSLAGAGVQVLDGLDGSVELP